MSPTQSPRTRSRKRQREEEVDEVSALSEHDSREFDDVTAARKDPHHQIEIPQSKRKRGREDTILWSYALSKPPKGQLERSNSNQELFYCKRCEKQCSSLTFARNYLKNKHGICISFKASKVDKVAKATISALFNKQEKLAAAE